MSKVEFSYKLENNLPAASEALTAALEMWAELTGGEMENLSHRDVSEGGTPVDTGRLRNSITYAHSGHQGFTHSYSDDEGNPYSDSVGSGAEPNTVYVGTMVDYAGWVEDGVQGRNFGGLGAGVGAHMLRNSVTDVGNKSQKLLKESLEAQKIG